MVLILMVMATRLADGVYSQVAHQPLQSGWGCFSSAAAAPGKGGGRAGGGERNALLAGPERGPLLLLRGSILLFQGCQQGIIPPLRIGARVVKQCRPRRLQALGCSWQENACDPVPLFPRGLIGPKGCDRLTPSLVPPAHPPCAPPPNPNSSPSPWPCKPSLFSVDSVHPSHPPRIQGPSHLQSTTCCVARLLPMGVLLQQPPTLRPPPPFPAPSPPLPCPLTSASRVA